MFELFREKLKESRAFSPKSRIILAVSGGVDSIVMAFLFNMLENEVMVAHCNFGLRDQESEEDEYFVREFCDQKNLKLYTRKFSTQQYARENGISIQMAARDLRYAWFEELRLNMGYDFIATAHNLDDQIETFFINLSRGTGIRGLSGISFQNGNIIRPLIYFTRKEIYDYAKSCGIPWREDSSNTSLKYSRNKIRHGIIPLFRELNLSFESTMGENIRKIRMAQDIYLQFIQTKKKILLQGSSELHKIAIKDVLNEEFGEIVLYETLNGFNFSPGVITDIWNSLNAPPGKKFFSETHRLIKDREMLFIEPNNVAEERKYYIEEDQQIITEPISLQIERISVQNYKIPTNLEIGSFDLDKLDFPLIVRKWYPGDYFFPLGMDNPKKLSDFFIDNKFSIPQKEQAWLLCSGQDIVWIIGYRIDDRFKLTEKTHHVLKISIK